MVSLSLVGSCVGKLVGCLKLCRIYVATCRWVQQRRYATTLSNIQKKTKKDDKPKKKSQEDHTAQDDVVVQKKVTKKGKELTNWFNESDSSNFVVPNNSDNGNLRCWLNAPVYSILFHKQIRDDLPQINIFNKFETPWQGTRICKKKYLKSITFLRKKIKLEKIF